MEPQGNQEFLEANVTVTDNQLALGLNNKVVVDALYRLPPYRQRLSSKVSNAANRRVLQGILTRIMQSTSSVELIVTGMLALQCEAQHCHIKDSLLSQVLSKAKARERKEGNVVRALDEASQAIAKWLMWVYIPLIASYAQSFHSAEALYLVSSEILP